MRSKNGRKRGEQDEALNALLPPEVHPIPQPGRTRRRREGSHDRLLCFGICIIGALVISNAVTVSLALWRNGGKWCSNSGKGSRNVGAGQPIVINGVKKTPFTFNNVFDRELTPKRPYFHWVGARDNLVIWEPGRGLVHTDLRTKKKEIIMKSSIFNRLKTNTYFVSSDLRYVLLAVGRVKNWRHSFSAHYQIYDRYQRAPAKQLIRVPSKGLLVGSRLQYCRWSTNGASLTFVYQNDLYYMDNPTSQPRRLTKSGQDQPYVLNGVPDWLYEEDVLGSETAHYWSPSATSLVYATFNDSRVPNMRYPWFGPSAHMYSNILEVPYPKAGNVNGNTPGPNSEATLHVLMVNNPHAKPRRLMPPVELRHQEHYYTMVKYINDTHVMISWTNRVQNREMTSLCNVTNGLCTTNHILIVSKGWVTVPAQSLMFFDDNHYVTVHPIDEGTGAGAFKHVSEVSVQADGPGRKTFLTRGTKAAKEIVGIDKENKFVYYISTNGDSRQEQLFRVGSAHSKHRAAICLTCSYGRHCKSVSASFSPTGHYYVETCNGPDLPTYTLKSTVDSYRVVLENNAALKDKLESIAMPKRKFVHVNVRGGYKTFAELLIPPSLALNEEDPQKMYPTLVFTYGGPASQLVKYNNRMMSTANRWMMYLASSHDVIVASVDARGSVGQGDKFMHEIYRRMGTVEVEDQITLGRALRNLTAVDSHRVAIWGWSYGGFTTSHVMGSRSHTYKCGLSIAPVTDQRYYDTAYTERHMGLATPKDNALGYQATRVMDKVKNFKGKKFFLAHGTADDNVHFRNSAELIKALTDEGIQFDFHLYVDKSHSLRGSAATPHLYTAMTDFLIHKCYGFENPLITKPRHLRSNGFKLYARVTAFVYFTTLLYTFLLINGNCVCV